MNARFELQCLYESVVILEPDGEVEAFLLAAFIRYDANVFYVSVDRSDNGHIERIRVRAEQTS